MRAMPYLLGLSLLALAACQADGSATQGPQECIAAQLQDAVGQPITDLGDEALPEPVRVMGPDSAMTMDFRPERLNVILDRQQIIQRIYCG